MLNLELLRKVQGSIRNENNPFDMGDWGTCICGHIRSVVQNIKVESADHYYSGWRAVEGARALGISIETAMVLFTGTMNNREAAIYRLDRLAVEDQINRQIKEEMMAAMRRATQPVPEPEPQPVPEEDLELVNA